MWWWLLALAKKKMCWWIASFGNPYHHDMFQYHLAAAILAAAAEMIQQRCMQAAHGVATMTSTTEITNAAILFYCAYYAHLFVMESWLWHVCLPRFNSCFYGDALQNGKQIFFSRLLQMTKYFVMRECEDIGDTSFYSQEGISIFKFSKSFLEISFRDFILFTLFTTLII
jgi:hypothetical protein